MLHCYPELVDVDRAEGTMMDEPYDRVRQDLFVGGSMSVYRPFTAYTESGVIGDPTLATAEKGERLFTYLCAELATLYEAINKHTRRGND